MTPSRAYHNLADWIQNSLLVKFFIIGFLILVLLFINAVLVMGLISERKMLHESATAEVAEKWGQRQTITGPVLAIPYLKKTSDGKTEESTAYVLPDQLAISGNTDEEVRKRGIHRIVLYKGGISLTGTFNTALSPDLQRLPLQWDRARLILGISDLTGIREAVTVDWNKQALALQSGTGSASLVGNGLSSNLTSLASDQQSAFKINLSLKGSNYLGFEPVGRETLVKLRSTWSSPSFIGKFITDTSSITKDGFTAEWRILDLNRPYPQQFVEGSYQLGRLPEFTDATRTYDGGVSAGTSFGVNLMETVNEYTKNERVAKYAILIIALTFMIFFFSEMVQGLRFHPLQYLLVGLALSLFYVLLLSFSEHIGFNAAYLVSAAATIALIAYYAGSTARSRPFGIRLALLLTAIFGFIFTILQMEDFALLAGSLGLFTALAAVMHYSRHIDWTGRGNMPEPAEEIE